MTDVCVIATQAAGLDAAGHELIEIAAVRVDGRTFEPLDHASARVRSVGTADAGPRASTNGTRRDAAGLRASLRRVAPLLDGALVAGHGVDLHWAWFARGFANAGLQCPTVANHRLDTTSLAWPLLASGEANSLALDAVCAALGLERPPLHGALGNAMASLEIARTLRDRAVAGRRVANLIADERPIVEALLERIEGGRGAYGPWRVDDGRDYRAETFAEVIDGLHYCAAELVRLGRPGVPPTRRPGGDP